MFFASLTRRRTPVVFFYLVWRHRRAILGNRGRLLDPKLHGTKLLWLPYRRNLWYWEAVEASRKILLSFPVQLFKPGSIIQPAYSLVVSLLFLKASERCKPFEHPADNFLNEALMWLLYVQFFAYLLLAAELDSKLIIDLVLSATMVFSICLALVITMWDVRREYVAAKDVKQYAASKWHKVSAAASEFRERRLSFVAPPGEPRAESTTPQL